MVESNACLMGLETRLLKAIPTRRNRNMPGAAHIVKDHKAEVCRGAGEIAQSESFATRLLALQSADFAFRFHLATRWRGPAAPNANATQRAGRLCLARSKEHGGSAGCCVTASSVIR